MMKIEEIKRAIEIIEEVDRLRSKGLCDLSAFEDGSALGVHQDLCNLSYFLHQEIERLENKPLTIEELKEMIGEPIWAQGYDYTDLKTGEGCWIFVESVDFDGFFFENAIIRGTYGDTLYDENTFYKHKPKED